MSHYTLLSYSPAVYSESGNKLDPVMDSPGAVDPIVDVVELVPVVGSASVSAKTTISNKSYKALQRGFPLKLML